MIYDTIPAQFTDIDVRDTLNSKGGTTGGTSLSFFDENARINMWSKRKPVKRSIMFNSEDPNWMRADAGNFGIVVPRASDVALLTGAYSYDMVSGSHYRRIADFVGYNRNASVPFGVLLPSGNIATSTYLTAKLTLYSLDATYNVMPADIFPNNSYFGCAITSGSQTLIKTMTTTIFDGGTTLYLSDCPLLNTAGSNVKIKAFVCTSQVPSWQGETTQSYYSLNATPGYAESTVSIVQKQDNVYRVAESGLSFVDSKKIIFVGNASLSAGSIVQSAKINARLTTSYKLTSVEVRATRASDYVVVGTRSMPINYKTEPKSLDTEWYEGITTTFTSDLIEPDVPALPPTDHYIFTCVFNYK